MFMSCEIESGYQFDESCTIDSLCDRQSACICAGRNAMRASLKDDVKNLYLRQKLDYSSIKAQVLSVINTYVAIRGLYSLLRPEMATVMRKGTETFVTRDAARIENRENILAVVHLKDMESYHLEKSTLLKKPS
jgi:hypothetical protein